MMSLEQYREEYPWLPDQPGELEGTVKRINIAVEDAFTLHQKASITGIKGLSVRLARLDLASMAMTAGNGYQTKVRSFNELIRGELYFVEAWIMQHNVAILLRQAGWLPVLQPSRIQRILDENDLTPRTRKKLQNAIAVPDFDIA